MHWMSLADSFCQERNSQPKLFAKMGGGDMKLKMENEGDGKKKKCLVDGLTALSCDFATLVSFALRSRLDAALAPFTSVSFQMMETEQEGEAYVSHGCGCRGWRTRR